MTTRRGHRVVRGNAPGIGAEPAMVYADRDYPPGTTERAERPIRTVEPPTQAAPVRRSVFGGTTGPRPKIDYTIPAFEGFRKRAMANTLLGLTFISPRGGMARRGEPLVMRPRPRYARVLRYPRGDREPQVYGGPHGASATTRG